jgi:hypothetical protein
MDDPNELALAMLAAVLAAVMLVAGELYLVATARREPTYPASAPLVISSAAAVRCSHTC